MADLALQELAVGASVHRTMTYHQDVPGGAMVKAEFGQDELSVVVPTGKTWNVQATIFIVETDA